MQLRTTYSNPKQDANNKQNIPDTNNFHFIHSPLKIKRPLVVTLLPALQ